MGQIVALNRLLKQPQLEGLIASLARSFRALTELNASPDCRKAKVQEKPPSERKPLARYPHFQDGYSQSGARSPGQLANPG